LMFQREAEMARIKGDRPRDVLDLIAHAVHGDNAVRASMLGVMADCRRSSWRLAHHNLPQAISSPMILARRRSSAAYPQCGCVRIVLERRMKDNLAHSGQVEARYLAF